jgi:sodium transport system permease protein
MIRRILTIWGKELLDTLRDRRTLAMMILVPVLMMPLFTLLPQYLLGGQIKQQSSGKLVIQVQGAANGPELINFLKKGGAEINEVPGDPEAFIRANKSQQLLIIPAGFSAQLAGEKPVQVSIMLDDSNMTSGVGASRLYELVSSFSQQVAAQRLTSRGLDPALLTPVVVNRQNVATEQQMGASFLSMFVPMFLVLFAFLGGMYTAIDVTAGEKERGTLEPLLVVPVSRAEIVLGKLLAVFVTSYAAVILSLFSTYVAFQLVPGDLMGSQMSFALPMSKIVWLMLAALPVTLFLNGLEMIICIYARSFKEAQNLITPLQLLLMVPSFFIGFMPGLRMPGWSYTLPALGQMALFRDILTEPALNMGNVALTMVSGLAAAVIVIVAAVYTFRRENVLFRS